VQVARQSLPAAHVTKKRSDVQEEHQLVEQDQSKTKGLSMPSSGPLFHSAYLLMAYNLAVARAGQSSGDRFA
jgi:hypothetical protein